MLCVCVCVCLSPTVLEKSEFKDESQFFRFYADEEMEGTSTKSKQLQRNDFKLIENILVKSLVVSCDTHELIAHAWFVLLVTVGLVGFLLLLERQNHESKHTSLSF